MKDLTGFPEGADLEEEDSKDCIKKNSLYVNGILYSPVLHTNEADMYGLLKVNSLPQRQFWKFLMHPVWKS